MSDAGPEQITVLPRRRHRWARRELWFVIAAVAVIAIVALAFRQKTAAHVAPGAPIGGIPVAAPAAVPAAQPASPSTP